jgi:NCS1 family nucleobase:cation symporter-1
MIAADAVPAWLSGLYNYAWFIGFAVSGLLYYVLMQNKKSIS